jgi:uncharacterized protein (TIGR02271 family)
MARRKPAQVVPVLEERLDVDRRTVELGRVRVAKHAQREKRRITEPVTTEEFSIERVRVEAPAGERVPEARWEGDTFVIPVLEERARVVREVWIREELHLTRHRRTTQAVQDVELLSEQVEVERSRAPEAGRDDGRQVNGRDDAPARARRGALRPGLAARQPRKSH